MCRVNGETSGALPVRYGVPQGSILGPLLFVIFVNDLPNNLRHCQTHLYADDTAISMSSTNAEQLAADLTEKLHDADRWMCENKLTLNMTKTKAMFFGTHQSIKKTDGVMVTTRDIEIETVGQYKYLGVILDSFLKLDQHVTYVKSKCMGRIKMLGKLRKIVGQDVSLQLYKSLITPILDYGDTVYDCLSAKDSHKLQTIQNCALRIILQKDRRTHVADMHREAKLHYLSDRRHQHTMNQTYKCVYGMAPSKLCEQLVPVQNAHVMTSRAKSNSVLMVPYCRLEMTKRSFRHRAPSMWSLLDDDLKLKPTYNSFKYSLTKSDMFEIVG